MISFRTIMIFVVISIVVLVAGKSRGADGGLGEITLNYEGTSATVFSFVLNNRSGQPIVVLASTTPQKKVIPWYTTMVCTPSNDSFSEAINSPPLGYSDKASRIRISPDKSLLLSVDKEDIVVRFKGGHCHLQLRLANGISVESKDFQL